MEVFVQLLLLLPWRFISYRREFSIKRRTFKCRVTTIFRTNSTASMVHAITIISAALMIAIIAGQPIDDQGEKIDGCESDVCVSVNDCEAFVKKWSEVTALLPEKSWDKYVEVVEFVKKRTCGDSLVSLDSLVSNPPRFSISMPQHICCAKSDLVPKE